MYWCTLAEFDCRLADCVPPLLLLLLCLVADAGSEAELRCLAAAGAGWLPWQQNKNKVFARSGAFAKQIRVAVAMRAILTVRSRMVINGVTKSNRLLLEFMKRPQTKLHDHTMSDSKVMRSKKVKIFRLVELFLQHSCFSLSIFYWSHNNIYWYAFASLVQILAWHNNGFVAACDVIMLFCPLLDDWILCRLGVVRQETWPYSTWFD